MTRDEVRMKLIELVSGLPQTQAELLLDFAGLLRRHSQLSNLPIAAAEPTGDLDDWDRALIAAEEYWFALPESVRREYSGKTAAVQAGRILDSDESLTALHDRILQHYLDQPVLFIEGDAEREPILVLHSPQLR